MTPQDAALAGLDQAIRTHGRDSELIIRLPKQTGEVEAIARLVIVDHSGSFPVRRDHMAYGWGPTVAEALARLWAGPTGVWRWVDEEGWRESQPALKPSSNPGPMAGQRLGRGDG